MPNSPVKMSAGEMSRSDSPRKKSELELLREKNIRQRDAYLTSLMKDPEFAEAMGAINSLNNNTEKKPRIRHNFSDVDPTFKSKIMIPQERRKSARLLNKSPIFTQDDLIDESTFKRKRYDDNDYSDLEEVVYRPRKTQVVARNATPYSPIISVEDVTENMINNIARRVSVKRYSENGTSCHQCRQKTNDQKTCCRSNNCVGVRGQFCGVCLENRYGEDAAAALRDPNWQCPVCRDICNCSFCRAKAGKRPTGILTPRALQAGHKSVKDFLESLKGEGDYPNQDVCWKILKDPKHLLGFSEDLTVAHMGDGNQHKLDQILTGEKLNLLLQEEEKKLAFLIEEYNKLYGLLGFIEDSGNAQMGNNTQYEIQSSRALKYIEEFLRQKQKALDLAKEIFEKRSVLEN